MKISESVSGFLYGTDVHYLDHLAPLCDLLSIPLIVTEKEIEQSLHKYYPTVLTYQEPKEAVAMKVLKSTSAIFTCLPAKMAEQIFFLEQHLLRKKLLTIWIGHGNSDKGRSSPFMEALQDEKILLVYGENMIDFLKSKGVLDHVYRYITIGNFRYRYYQKFKGFYDKLLPRFKRTGKTILYAPTWGKTAESSPVLKALPHLLKTLPDSYNLIVKIHPNSLLQYPTLKELPSQSNVLFLHDFPPIYPLLDQVDILLGDFSSINYDFLTFNKPMFFLHDEESKTMIHECGLTIQPEDFPNMFSLIEKALPDDEKRFGAKRKELYSYTFGEIESESKLAEEIFQTIHDYIEEEPHFL